MSLSKFQKYLFFSMFSVPQQPINKENGGNDGQISMTIHDIDMIFHLKYYK